MDHCRGRVSLHIVLAFLLFIGTSACGGSNGSTAESGTVVDSAGVRLVSHPSGAVPASTWTVEDEPTLAIGQVEGDAPYLFGRITSARLLSDGRILVADAQPPELRFFDSSGRFLHSMGGTGEGPGEFTWIDWVALFPGDTMVAWDGGLRRLTVFGPEGDLAETEQVRLPGEDQLYFFAEGSFGSDGLLLMVQRPNDTSPPLNRFVESIADYYRWSRTGGETQAIATVTTRSKWIDDGSRYWTVPFLPKALLAADANELYVSTAESFSLTAYSPDGAVEMRLSMSVPPAPVRENAIREYRAERLARAEGTETYRILADQFDRWPWPDHYPALDRLTVDQGGCIWVRQYRVADEPGLWRVFSSNGTYLAFVEIPGGVRVLDIGSDAILVRALDAFDVQRVEVLGLDRQGVNLTACRSG